ncbi:hypothetical protein F5X98DRAFT_381867 [Xylaria grammica]|nr:hypothetical protein F5X98DRAFT_381867 [Xylaria grammica]
MEKLRRDIQKMAIKSQTYKTQPSHVTKRERAVLGQDLGNSSTEATLGYIDQSDGRVVIERVVISGQYNHPAKPQSSCYASFEFIANAALVDGSDRLLVGRRSLNKNCNFPIKLMLLVGAGIPRNSLMSSMPDASVFFRACDAGKITKDMMAQAIVEHLRLIRNMALQQSDADGLTIDTIVLSFPNYLCEKEDTGDFNKYIDYYLLLMRQAWKEHEGTLEFLIASEGQAGGAYVVSSFKDALGEDQRALIWDRDLKDLKRCAGSVPLLMLDWGSSGLNTQHVEVYFVDGRESPNIQSTKHNSWSTGVYGGYNLVNNFVRELIEEKLRRNLSEDETAALMVSWEAAKYSYDHTQGLPIVLHGTGIHTSVHLHAEEVRAIILKALGPALKAAKDHIDSFVTIHDYCGIVFLGGTWENPGIHATIEEIMQRHAKDADPRIVRHTFIGNWGPLRPTTVSAGLAVNGCRLHQNKPFRVLDGSAIAIYKEKFSDDKWSGDKEAKFLLSKGCVDLPGAEFKPGRGAQKPARFTLLCDPGYYTNNNFPSMMAEGEFPTIKVVADRHIGQRENRTMWPYNLNWEVDASKCPPGAIRWMVVSTDARDLAKRPPVNSLADKSMLTLFLVCHKVGKHDKTEYHPEARMWRLRLRTDVASLLLHVADHKVDAVEYPVWCSKCEANLFPGEAYVRRGSRISGLCAACFASSAKGRLEYESWEKADLPEYEGQGGDLANDPIGQQNGGDVNSDADRDNEANINIEFPDRFFLAFARATCETTDIMFLREAQDMSVDIRCLAVCIISIGIGIGVGVGVGVAVTVAVTVAVAGQMNVRNGVDGLQKTRHSSGM